VIQDGYLSGQQAAMLTDQQLELFSSLRPNAVALVDAFDYPDQVGTAGLDNFIAPYNNLVFSSNTNDTTILTGL